MKKHTSWTLVIGAAVIALATIAPSAGARAGEAAACKPTIVAGVVRFCGPAQATLGVWPGFTFRHGDCTYGPDKEFTLELGTLAPTDPGERADNKGKDYLKIQIFGPFTAPTSGAVIAWHHGVRWSGYGRSLTRRRILGGWKFVASKSPIGLQMVKGTFRCEAAS
jgi:hypothetical protein